MSDEWRDRRACKGVDPSVFFPVDPQGVAAAKVICERCPVSAECVEEGERLGDRDGIRGGLTPGERGYGGIRRYRGVPGHRVSRPARRRERIPAPADQLVHGRLSTYTNHRCRCPECKRAASKYNRRAARERRERGLPPGDSRHGTPVGYGSYACRCQACRDAVGHQPRPSPADCGTHAAYVRHRSNDETPCEECRAAEAAYRKQRRAATA